LRDGEKIKVSIKLNRSKLTIPAETEGEASGPGIPGLAHPHGIPKQFLSLRVPPPSAYVHQSHPNTQPSATTQDANSNPGEEDEWGDFNSAT
jgi:hypothetical protein